MKLHIKILSKIWEIYSILYYSSVTKKLRNTMIHKIKSISYKLSKNLYHALFYNLDISEKASKRDEYYRRVVL